MSVVVDASLTLTWYFDDETTPATEAVLDQVSETGAVVPTLWRLEVANAFQSALRRKLITALCRDESLSELALLPITVDVDTDTYAWSTTLRLAERFALTIYDAAYLELAQRRSFPRRLSRQETTRGMPFARHYGTRRGGLMHALATTERRNREERSSDSRSRSDFTRTVAYRVIPRRFCSEQHARRQRLNVRNGNIILDLPKAGG